MCTLTPPPFRSVPFRSVLFVFIIALRFICSDSNLEQELELGVLRLERLLDRER